MPAILTSEQVWKQIEKRMFAVLGYVTPKGEARTTGIVYVTRRRKFYIGADSDSWKARHIQRNPNVSLTVTIPKRIPFMPWISIPDATITLQGQAQVTPVAEADQEIVMALFHGMAADPEMRANAALMEVAPRGDFITYGVGVSLRAMRDPGQARGRAPVG